jgi:hypothetical protein
MGTLAGPCHACEQPIPLADLEARLAVILMKRRYCRRCTQALAAKWAGPKEPGPVLKLARRVLGRREP